MAKENQGKRRDSKHRVLRNGESIRADGKYQFKYLVNGKAKFVYSWKLEPTDKLPQGKRPCLSLRELEKQIGYDRDNGMNPTLKKMTVMELVEKYLATKTGMRPNTMAGYNCVRNILKKEEFSGWKIGDVKTSDAKLFLIKLQSDGKRYSTIHTVRGVLRPAFQMAVDDDVLNKNPFGFQLAGVLINDSVMREAITKKQMEKFLKFIHDDIYYCRYYEAIYILFHTGLRISEFCGLTIKDIDLKRKIINVDHQLQRTSHMGYVIEKTKTNAGTRKLPMTDEVAECFKMILKEREAPKVEKMIGEYTGFLYLDENGMPLVALHWENRLRHMVGRYNEIFREQMPNITPHVCRHTYCSLQAKAGMYPKTLQYLMGHSDIGVTMNVYTHLGLEDAETEMARLQEAEDARREQEKLMGKTNDVRMTKNQFRAG
ncbi:MAG: site-specific integrase [Clostridia bacterium]|nr:site-specific integrase [Clostridia bacterium]